MERGECILRDVTLCTIFALLLQMSTLKWNDLKRTVPLTTLHTHSSHLNRLEHCSFFFTDKSSKYIYLLLIMHHRKNKPENNTVNCNCHNDVHDLWELECACGRTCLPIWPVGKLTKPSFVSLFVILRTSLHFPLAAHSGVIKMTWTVPFLIYD